ncbi:hypothetical protein [Brevibacillus porteri]|uniref:hypothetical protein n=1 Tax=Brevibacillus porteri TaxID=2126350 RepID=UPI0036380E40
MEWSENLKSITIWQLREYHIRKSKLKTGSEFKALAREIRDSHNLTDQEALAVFNSTFEIRD